MRSVLNFFSMLAFGLMGAAGLVAGAPVISESWSGWTAELPALDYLSVAIGLCLGLVIGVFGQVSWSGMPRRASRWVAWHLRRLVLLALAATVVAVMLSH